MISDGTQICIGAQLAEFDAQFQVSIRTLQKVRCCKGTKMLAIGCVEKQTMALSSRLPKKKPPAVRSPLEALGIQRLRIP
jgi:hypothetical protein